MSEKDLIKKIKMLKEVHPGSTWVDFCRSWLEKKIEIREQILTLSQVKKNKLLNLASLRPSRDRQDKHRQVNLLSQIFDIRLIFNFLKPAAPALAGLLLFLTGSIGLVFASKSSLPGDFLFPVKITFEKARLVLAPDKANLQIEITNNRLEELRVIVGDNSQSKSSDVAQALEKLNQQLTTVKKELPKMVEKQKLEISQIAKTATEITKKIPASASIISSSCASFASSSCAFFGQEENQELTAIQTMKMAQEIIDSIEELSKKESSDSPDEVGKDQNLR